MQRKWYLKVFVGMALGLLAETSSAGEFPRPPLCELQRAKALNIVSLEQAFRRDFCRASRAASCNKRWQNTQTFLGKALADDRIFDIGTVAYMFGTIFAETDATDFSPSSIETIGKLNKDRVYVKDKFFGRGWIQLTFKDKYAAASSVLHLDLVSNPDLALTPDNSYEILFNGMSRGWIEVYRTSTNGAVDRNVPIRLGDFVSATSVDYDLARAVINANCRKKSGKCAPPDIEYQEGLFIPSADSLDSGEKASTAASKMERLLCNGQPT